MDLQVVAHSVLYLTVLGLLLHNALNVPTLNSTGCSIIGPAKTHALLPTIIATPSISILKYLSLDYAKVLTLFILFIDLNFYVDSSSAKDFEFGTIEYPFIHVDDVFRLVFNSPPKRENININLRGGLEFYL